MDKRNNLSLDPEFSPRSPASDFGRTRSNSDRPCADKRIARLLILLRQLEECAAGLGELPERELTEILLSAIRLCGFLDPAEASAITATVLEAIETRGPFLEGW